MNLLTLPLVNQRHHIGKLKGFAYLLFEAFMRAYVDANMKLLYPSCLVRKVRVHTHMEFYVVQKRQESVLRVSVKSYSTPSYKSTRIRGIS